MEYSLALEEKERYNAECAQHTREYTDEQIQEREERKARKKAEEDAIRDQQAANKESRSQQAEARLKFLLSQSDIFSHFGSVKDENKVMSKSQSMTSIDAETGEKKKKTHRNKRSSNDEDLDDDEKAIRDEMGDSDDEESGGGKGSKRNVGNTILLKQPSCIIGAMRPYQLEGLNWMIRLTENGVNGILADEMGLGKTLQSISVIGYMYEYLNVSGPHLVTVPKSTLSNWIIEFKRWCPVIRAIKFHGTGDERSDFIRDVIQPGRMHEERGWDVIVTTPEVLNMEKNSLSKIAWKYLIIDEAHRLKHADSQIAKTVRMLDTQHRLLLTSTPLQNNLHGLWALLNFLLPDVFASAEQFDDWFNLNVDDTEVKQRIIGQLHKILRPFMLRRLKADVEKSLPPKTETILFTGLTATQRDLYKNILKRDIDIINSTSGSRTAILNIVMQLVELIENQLRRNRNWDHRKALMLVLAGSNYLLPSSSSLISSSSSAAAVDTGRVVPTPVVIQREDAAQMTSSEKVLCEMFLVQNIMRYI